MKVSQDKLKLNTDAASSVAFKIKRGSDVMSPSTLIEGKYKLLRSSLFQFFYGNPRPETEEQKLDCVKNLGDYLKVFASDDPASPGWSSWSNQIYTAAIDDLFALREHLQKALQGEESQLEERIQYLAAWFDFYKVRPAVACEVDVSAEVETYFA